MPIEGTMQTLTCACRSRNLFRKSSDVELAIGSSSQVVRGVRIVCLDCGRQTPHFTDGPIAAVRDWNIYMTELAE